MHTTTQRSARRSADYLTDPGTVIGVSNHGDGLNPDDSDEQGRTGDGSEDVQKARAASEAKLFAELEQLYSEGVETTAVKDGEHCPHPWWDLDFLPRDEGLACSVCGQRWELADSAQTHEVLLLVWHSAKTAVVELNEQCGALARFVGTRLGARSCAACGEWDDKDALVHAGELWMCPHHVGDALGMLDDVDDGVVDGAVRWALGHGLDTSTDLRGRLLWDRLLSCSERVAERVEANGPVPAHDIVDVDTRTAERLGVDARLSTLELCEAIAERLELDTPSNRISHMFLLGLLVAALAVEPALSVEEAAQRVVTFATPHVEVARMILVVDLCGAGMADGTTFNGDMAEDVLRVVSLRAATTLVELLRS